jgi:hypothetical protein
MIAGIAVREALRRRTRPAGSGAGFRRPSLASCNADGAEHVSWLRRIDP